MAELKLTKTRLIEGVWEGELKGVVGDNPPELSVAHLTEAFDGLNVTNENGRWFVRVSIPLELIADGVQTFVISEVSSGETLASFALLSGEGLSEDIRAEMDLLRAELDMLKRAFRRHCLETGAADG